MAVQESVEAKATLAPGLLWRLVRSNRCPTAACIYSGKRFHYSTFGVYSSVNMACEECRAEKSEVGAKAKLGKATKGRNVARRIRRRGKAKRKQIFRRGKETGLFIQE